MGGAESSIYHVRPRLAVVAGGELGVISLALASKRRLQVSRQGALDRLSHCGRVFGCFAVNEVGLGRKSVSKRDRAVKELEEKILAGSRGGVEGRILWKEGEKTGWEIADGGVEPTVTGNWPWDGWGEKVLGLGAQRYLCSLT